MKLVTDADLSAIEQDELKTALRFAALEVNWIHRKFPVTPRVREFVRMFPEAVNDLFLPHFMLIEDHELEEIMKGIDRKALAKADYVGVLDILVKLRSNADEFFDKKKPGRYSCMAKWKPLELCCNEALSVAQHAEIFLPSVGTRVHRFAKKWRVEVTADYPSFKTNLGWLYVTEAREARVDLRDEWSGFMLEEYVTELYNNSQVFLEP